MTDLNIKWRPELPAKMDYGIGSVGCGGIVQYAHMPAYQKAGFKLVGAYDINRENAQKVAHDNQIPIVMTRWMPCWLTQQWILLILRCLPGSSSKLWKKLLRLANICCAKSH